MKREFIQVKPGNGYLIHAVPADVERLNLGTYKAFWANGRVLCGGIKTLNAQRLPNLNIQFDRTVPLYGSQALPFTADMLLTADRPICITCAKRVAWVSSH